MKKEDPDNKQPEYTRYSEDEEQVLDLNELMDVQGGIDDKELSKCGLGCYMLYRRIRRSYKNTR